MKLLFAFLVNLIIMPQIDGKTVLDLELDAVALIEEGIKSEIGVSWREARIGLEIIELNTPSFYFDADATEGLSVKLQGVGLSYFTLPANLPGFYIGLGFRRNKMLVNDIFLIIITRRSFGTGIYWRKLVTGSSFDISILHPGWRFYVISLSNRQLKSLAHSLKLSQAVFSPK